MNVQNDMFNGTLPVLDAESAIAEINTLAAAADAAGHTVIRVRTVHPYYHCTFSLINPAPLFSKFVRSNGKQITVLPEHCVWNTKGSVEVTGLDRKASDWEVLIGQDANGSSYSAMDGQVWLEAMPTHKTLAQHLTENKISTITVCGFLREFGVTETVADARKRGYLAHAEMSAVRGLVPGTIPCHQTADQAVITLRENFEKRLTARMKVIADEIERMGFLTCACEECLGPKINAALADSK